MNTKTDLESSSNLALAMTKHIQRRKNEWEVTRNNKIMFNSKGFSIYNTCIKIIWYCFIERYLPPKLPFLHMKIKISKACASAVHTVQ